MQVRVDTYDHSKVLGGLDHPDAKVCWGSPPWPAGYRFQFVEVGNSSYYKEVLSQKELVDFNICKRS
jgi:hypothetical protein